MFSEFAPSARTTLLIVIVSPFIALGSTSAFSNSRTVSADTGSNGHGMADDCNDVQLCNNYIPPIDLFGDPDLDGLNNMEEYNAGTNPNNSDTDGGGENDGSEVKLFHQDPLDPADDMIQSIPWVKVSPGVDENRITFGSFPEYSHMKIYRSLLSYSGYLPINQSVSPTGLYIDTGLTAGTTYYYRMLAIDSDGHGSEVSPTCSATPNEYSPWPLFLPAITHGEGE